MSDLFSLAMPWWEFVLRAVLVYAIVLVLVRVTGKRSIGQFTPFDLLLLVLLGTAVQNALVGPDTSLLGGLLLAATLIGLNYLVGWITARSRRVRHLVEGEPIVLARNGQVFEQVLMRELVSSDDFELAMRQQGCASVRDIQIALLETSGQITILQHPPRRVRRRARQPSQSRGIR